MQSCSLIKPGSKLIKPHKSRKQGWEQEEGKRAAEVAPPSRAYGGALDAPRRFSRLAQPSSCRLTSD